MKRLSTLLILLVSASQLSGCFTAVLGGAAAGGAMAVDRRTTGIYLEDENVEIKAARKFSTYLGEGAHVNVTSYNLTVLLTGEVPNEEKKKLAEALTREIPNVRNIHNALTVGFASSIADRTADTYTTSKVKTRIVTENHKITSAVKVVTEADVVYLMGIVAKEEADAAVEIARNTEGVSKVVKVFEYVK